MKKQNKYLPLSAKEKKLFKNNENWNTSIEKLFNKTGIRLFETFSLFKEYNETIDYVMIIGKGAKERKIPFVKETSELIKLWRDKIKWNHLRYQDFTLDAEHRKLVAKSRSTGQRKWLKHITPEMIDATKKVGNFRKLISRKFVIAAEIAKTTGEKYNAHRFRATFATDLIDNGNDLVTVQTLMGHSSVTQTAEYVQSSDLKMRSAIKSLDRQVGYEGMTREELYQEVQRLRSRWDREQDK